jgi:hypothetical protein
VDLVLFERLLDYRPEGVEADVQRHRDGIELGQELGREVEPCGRCR